MRLLSRSFLAALAGGLLGAAILTAAYLRESGLTFEMNAPLPAYVSGVYSDERDGSVSFAWTDGHTGIDLRRLDRHAPWSCTLRFRAFRPEGVPMPNVRVLVDSAQAASVTAAPEFHDLQFAIPAGPRGARLTIYADPTFTPGTKDTRTLGIQIDRLHCKPDAMAWPPSRAMQQVAASAGFVGFMFSLLLFPLAVSLVSALAVAAGASLLLTTGGAIYGDYSSDVFRMTVFVVLAAGVLITSIERARGERFSNTARAVGAISVVALLLKIAGLLHPAKPVIDAMFHAHRLDWVVGGRYFFTQPFVGDVEMPYAIGLYVFAWPWTWIFTDHVGLIRIVTAASDVLAGLLLYPLVGRALGDRRAGALAVLFYNLAPLPYTMLGNANLTNMFGQSVALVVMAAAVLWNLDLRRLVPFVVFTALVTWAFSSHVSTITMLLATLGALAVLYFWRGDQNQRRAAIAIAVACVAALALSWLIFYQHFSDEISAAFTRMFSGGSSTTPATAEEAARGYMSVPDRVKNLFAQAGREGGWPILILASIGAWSIWRRGIRDRLVSALIAWAAMWLVFSTSSVFSRLDQEYVRYVTEFLGRINLAVLPLVAILAGRGAAAGWSEETPATARTLLRTVSVVLIAWAVVVAVQSILGWFYR